MLGLVALNGFAGRYPGQLSGGMQAQPGRIREEITVPFERPRMTEIIASGEFMRLKQHCLQLSSQRQARDTLPRLAPLGL